MQQQQQQQAAAAAAAAAQAQREREQRELQAQQQQQQAQFQQQQAQLARSQSASGLPPGLSGAAGHMLLNQAQLLQLQMLQQLDPARAAAFAAAIQPHLAQAAPGRLITAPAAEQWKEERCIETEWLPIRLSCGAAFLHFLEKVRHSEPKQFV
ncbi:unnamed protein product [Heligmosomoides polygyrus]|uniref:AP2/ERF domain-containing protein n=1 Tax=Heligmosomoides polygyrus TaxID=6339 RepID=A0A183FNK4_HELPZ|nr:unnamed protein product [Heligmosomoides polygyrus]